MPLPTASSVSVCGTTAPIGTISISMRPPDISLTLSAHFCLLMKPGSPAVSDVWNVQLYSAALAALDRTRAHITTDAAPRNFFSISVPPKFKSICIATSQLVAFPSPPQCYLCMNGPANQPCQARAARMRNSLTRRRGARQARLALATETVWFGTGPVAML